MQRGSFLISQVTKVCAFLEKNSEWARPGASCSVMDRLPKLVIGDVVLGVLVKQSFNYFCVWIDCGQMERCDILVAETLLRD